MSKRKKNDPNPIEEDDDDDDDGDNDHRDSRGKHHQQEPKKIYDFHKKTVEVYPERLRELNRQFVSSVSSQITTEPYSVLVGNCLDYVRQYFNYEDDLLKYSPWLAARLKQSRTDIVKCLQESIDIYEALARNDFDRILENKNVETPSTIRTSNESTTPSFQIRPPTTSSSIPPFAPSKTATVDSTLSSTGFTFKLPTTTDSTGFAFKLPTTNPSSFTLSVPTTGFGTSTFSSTSFGSQINTEKQSTGSASSISFTPPKFSFAPSGSTTGDQQGTTEDNDDESNEPPEPEKVEHESNAKLTYRCRMGVKKGDKLIKRGPVQVVLKETNGKHQLVVRSDDALGRLYLNILWSKVIQIKKSTAKDLTFVCQLNPGMTEIPENEFVMILFRFDSETERNDAHDKLDKERT